MSAGTGEHRVACAQFEENLSPAVWSVDGRDILFRDRQRTNSNLYRHDVNTGAVERLTDVKGTLRPPTGMSDAVAFLWSMDNHLNYSTGAPRLFAQRCSGCH